MPHIPTVQWGLSAADPGAGPVTATLPVAFTAAGYMPVAWLENYALGITSPGASFSGLSAINIDSSKMTNGNYYSGRYWFMAIGR